MKYTIKAGQKDWSPMEFPWPYFPKVGSQWIYDIVFTESCWYNWLPDMDQHDWNKIGGVTNMFSLNNVDSALIGWRPEAETPGRFELIPYFNVGKTVKLGQEIMPVVAEEAVKAYITYMGNKVFSIQIGFAPGHSEQLEKFWFGRRIGMNMGGANNSPGPYGGVASQDMEMYVTHWYVK